MPAGGRFDEVERLCKAKRLLEAAGALQQAALLTSELQLRFQARRRLATIYVALQEKDKAQSGLAPAGA